MRRGTVTLLSRGLASAAGQGQAASMLPGSAAAQGAQAVAAAAPCRPAAAHLGIGPAASAQGLGHQAAAAAGPAQRISWGLSWRGLSTEELRIVHSELTEGQYHHVADHMLDELHDKLEAFVEEKDIDGSDIEYGQGVLTVKLGKYGTYVINKQTPNRQVWMSSPVSGPFRYDWVHATQPGAPLESGRWVYHRDGRDLLKQLEEELKQLLGDAPAL